MGSLIEGRDGQNGGIAERSGSPSAASIIGSACVF